MVGSSLVDVYLYEFCCSFLLFVVCWLLLWRGRLFFLRFMFIDKVIIHIDCLAADSISYTVGLLYTRCMSVVGLCPLCNNPHCGIP